MRWIVCTVWTLIFAAACANPQRPSSEGGACTASTLADLEAIVAAHEDCPITVSGTSLTSLDGLQGLVHTGALFIKNDPNLTDLSALDDIGSIGTLDIVNAPGSDSLDISTVTQIVDIEQESSNVISGGQTSIAHLGFLHDSHLASLSFAELASIDVLDLEDDAVLSIEGAFPVLQTISGDVSVRNCSKVTSSEIDALAQLTRGNVDHCGNHDDSPCVDPPPATSTP